MVQALCVERIGEGLHHMLLPHHFGEIAGAVLAGEHEVGHPADSTGCAECPSSVHGNGAVQKSAPASVVQSPVTGLLAW